MSAIQPVLVWHRTIATALGAGAGGVIAVSGILFSRPEVIMLGLPLALLSVLGLLRTDEQAEVGVSIETRVREADRLRIARDATPQTSEIESVIIMRSTAELVQLSVAQPGRYPRQILVRGNGATVRARARLLHSGPTAVLSIFVRAISDEGMRVSTPSSEHIETWNAAPVDRRIRNLPLSPHLRGLHGAHEGRRPGQGGDFRDIHPFTPGDELRRVDWKATARLARRPGDLFVRRTNTLSDASVVVVIDTADDLGEVVASWGKGDPERSGVTSLDHARDAARTIATSAIENGDRVALHELAFEGRSVRSGGGSRHLSRLISSIAATGPRGDDRYFRRTPPVPQGSVIYVMSTFFEGAAAQIALTWRASGHRVIAVDILPRPDGNRLTPEQRAAMRTVLAERDDVFHDLHHTGVDVLVWDAEIGQIQADLRQLGRTR